MIKVNSNITWDQSKILDTWRPVLEKAGVREDLMQFAANYAHQHILIEQATSLTPDKEPSMLPLAIKILSMLNLSNKNVQLTPGPNYEYIDDVTEKNGFGETHTFAVSVNMLASSQMSPQLAEELLVKKLTDMINFNLRKFDTIVIYCLAASISIISEATLAPKMYLKCRIKFWDRNLVVEDLYQVSNDGEFYSIMRLEGSDQKNYINVKDDNGNSYLLDPDEGCYIKAISETDVMALADELDNKAETLKNSASILRRAIFEK